MTLPLEDISEGFIVKGISGLGPVKAVLASSSFANMDGEQHYSSRREARNIIIKLGLNPNYGESSVHELRSLLYDFFMPKTQAKLEFTMFDRFSTNILTQTLNLEIMGRIESLEPAIFAKDPEVDLSIMCYNPDFVNPIPVIFNGATVSDLTEAVLNYEGSVETGVIFTLMVNRPISTFSIYHKTPDDKTRTIDFLFALNADNEVKISSIFGSKYVRLFNDGIESPILYAISPQSSWIELFPGDNKFRVYTEGDPIPFSIEYTNKYGGL